MAFWRNYYHLVWATDNRAAWILPEYEPALYACIVKKAAELDTYVYAINGMTDHLHVVASIPPKHSVAWIVKNLKGNSSHFVNHVLQPAAFHFAWQQGYGCLTMGETQRATAMAYVHNQKAHHQAQTANLWLERYTEFDEGPADVPNPDAVTTSAPKRLGEERAPYDAAIPFLF